MCRVHTTHELLVRVRPFRLPGASVCVRFGFWRPFCVRCNSFGGLCRFVQMPATKRVVEWHETDAAWAARAHNVGHEGVCPRGVRRFRSVLDFQGVFVRLGLFSSQRQVCPLLPADSAHLLHTQPPLYTHDFCCPSSANQIGSYTRISTGYVHVCVIVHNCLIMLQTTQFSCA